VTLIRPARLEDLDGITAIYNQNVLHSTASFESTPRTTQQQQRWFAEHGGRHPLHVAEENELVSGWASLSSWSFHDGYDATTEISVYVTQERRRQGIGRALMESVISAGQRAGVHCIVARITSANQLSVRLHRNLGFEAVGVMREVGSKFGKLLDVVVMQKLLEP
jgi:L-amino acid N-acyltransferase YncA